MPENQYKFQFGYFYLFLGMFTAIVIFPVWFVSRNPEYDAPNLVTLVIEVAIAVAITVTVYVYSKRDQKMITGLVQNIEKLETEQQQFLKEQKEFQEKRRVFSTNMIRSYLIQIKSVIQEYDTATASVESIIPDAKDLLNYYRNIIEQDLKNMTFQLTFAADVLEPHHVEAIRHLLEIIDYYIKQKPPYDAQHHGIFGNIDSLLKDLPNYPA